MSAFVHRPARATGASSQFGGGGYLHGGAKTQIRSAKNLVSHSRVKVRSSGQSTVADVSARDLVSELAERERVAAASSGGGGGDGKGRLLIKNAGGASAGAGAGAAAAAALAPVAALLAAFDDRDDDEALTRGEKKGVNDDDADDIDDDDVAATAASNGNDVDDTASTSSDDDEEELMRELERIRREREVERTRREAEASALASSMNNESAARSNPLLAGALAPGGGLVKRRFGDDTVFSGTHADEPTKKKRFINDIVRSDFHRKFLARFIA